MKENFTGKRISVSMTASDYEDIRNYCLAHSLTMSSFMTEQAMNAVRADATLTALQYIIHLLSRLENDGDTKTVEELKLAFNVLDGIVKGGRHA